MSIINITKSIADKLSYLVLGRKKTAKDDADSTKTSLDHLLELSVGNCRGAPQIQDTYVDVTIEMRTTGCTVALPGSTRSETRYGTATIDKRICPREVICHGTEVMPFIQALDWLPMEGYTVSRKRRAVVLTQPFNKYKDGGFSEWGRYEINIQKAKGADKYK